MTNEAKKAFEAHRNSPEYLDRGERAMHRGATIRELEEAAYLAGFKAGQNHDRLELERQALARIEESKAFDECLFCAEAAAYHNHHGKKSTHKFRSPRKRGT